MTKNHIQSSEEIPEWRPCEKPKSSDSLGDLVMSTCYMAAFASFFSISVMANRFLPAKPGQTQRWQHWCCQAG